MKNLIVEVNSANDIFDNGPSCAMVEVDENTIRLVKSTQKLILDHGLTSASFAFGMSCVWSDYISDTMVDDRTDQSYVDDVASIANNPVIVQSCNVVVTEQGFYLRANPGEDGVRHQYESALIGFDALDNGARYVDQRYF